MGSAYCVRVSEAPQAQRFSGHLYDPIMTGKLDTGEDIPLPSSSGSYKAAQTHSCSSSNRVW